MAAPFVIIDISVISHGASSSRLSSGCAGAWPTTMGLSSRVYELVHRQPIEIHTHNGDIIACLHTVSHGQGEHRYFYPGRGSLGDSSIDLEGPVFLNFFNITW